MEYRVAKNRCAVIINHLQLPISRDEALDILKGKGFVLLEVNIITLAQQCVNTSRYRRGAQFSEAPEIVDCSSFIKWLYAQVGIWLPRRSIQQRELGEMINVNEIIAGDVVFTSGRINYYYDDPADGVGHVGIATGNETVIHAANVNDNVAEVSIDKFLGKSNFRGARRYMPKGLEIFTFETPPNREVETSDDLKWIILQS